MESKLKDQNFDLEYGLSKAQKEIKYEIINEFREYVKDMPSQNLAQKWKAKQNLRLIETMDQSVEEYQEKVKQKLIEARNEYQKVLKQMLKLYDIEMKVLIKAQLKTSLNDENLDSFHNRSKEKVERIFKEESVNFYKGNIEKEFLSKLNEEIIKSKNKYEILFSHHLNNFKTEVKEKLRKENYISENKINKLHANAKQRITNSMKKLEDTDLIEIAISLLDKYLKFFKKCNEENDRQEQQIAKNAIDLALTLYNNCFEAKLKTGLFLQNEINDINNKLFDYTLNALNKACDFNEDQTYLIRRCEEDFKIKVVENYEHIITKYQEMFDRTTNLLTKAKTDALKKYCSEMCSRLSVKAYFKTNEFSDIHYECSKIGFKTYDSLTEFIKKDFDTETANRIVLENHSEIRKNITTKKDYYKSLNDEKAPKTSTIAVYFGHRYISAATYDNKVDVVFDKNNQTLRFNSIAIRDKIIFGSDAKDYYRKTYSALPTFENFDIKQLIGRERKTILKEELLTYPFEFLPEKLSVFFNFEGIKFEFSIESLLALMVMNLKADAEKQFSKMMSNIVITIPTNYNLIQKNGIKNVAKIADFEDIHLITELSAAAIGYWADKLKYYHNNSKTVLFAVINGFDCDIAISTITHNKIQFVAHYHQKLNTTEKGSHYSFPKILNPTNWIGSKEKDLTLKNLGAMIEKTIKKRSFKKKDIDECVIAGDSQLIGDVKNHINFYFGFKIAYDCDPIDIIIKGSTIYSGMLSKKVPLIEVTEVTNFPISTVLQRNYWNGKKEKVLETNVILPHVKCFNSFAPMRSNLPLKIHVYQDHKLVMTHLIETIPQLYNYRTQWNDFDYKFIFDNFGEINVQSFVAKSHYKLREKLDSTVIETGLTERQVNEERLQIIHLLDKIEEKNKLLNEESLVEQSKIELINYCIEEKKKFDNNSELRSLIKRQILKEIDETLNYLKTKVLNLEDIKSQKQKLDNALEILLNK
jgi:molecular chaperone DnaK (HSP70)